jgi:hypothetical protein
MADYPTDVLPHLVDPARQLTGAASDGVSLLRSEPGSRRLSLEPSSRRARAGRAVAPSGARVRLDREREHRGARGAACAAARNRSARFGSSLTEKGHFDAGDARVMTELASFVGIALRLLQSEERLKAALEQQENLAREMSHRIKNMFAIVASTTRASAKGARIRGRNGNPHDGVADSVEHGAFARSPELS